MNRLRSLEYSSFIASSVGDFLDRGRANCCVSGPLWAEQAQMDATEGGLQTSLDERTGELKEMQKRSVEEGGTTEAVQRRAETVSEGQGRRRAGRRDAGEAVGWSEP